MKMRSKFVLYIIEKKVVAVPSTDYYARPNDTQQEELTVLTFIEDFDDKETAIKYLEDIIIDNDDSVNIYTILETFQID